MVLRITAYVLNAGLLCLGALSLLGGGICAAVITILAGAFNLFALIRGGTDEGAVRNIGLFANAIAFVYGIVAAFQAWGIYNSETLPPQAATVAALVAGAISLCLLSAGIVTMIVFAREQ